MSPTFTYWHIGLIVTGVGEATFLPRFLRALMAGGDCNVEVCRRIGQRSAIRSPARKLKMVGAGKTVPTIDEEEIGLPARRYLMRPDRPNSLLVVIDDVEQSRAATWPDAYQRYRAALDALLPAEMRVRAAVHFLKNMLEAYYFADADAINSVLGLSLTDYAGDVEDIAHPKGGLKKLFAGFDEIEHGQRIVNALDLERVLGNPETCPMLRALVGWIVVRLGHGIDGRFHLDRGVYSVITGRQIAHQ